MNEEKSFKMYRRTGKLGWILLIVLFIGLSISEKESVKANDLDTASDDENSALVFVKSSEDEEDVDQLAKDEIKAQTKYETFVATDEWQEVKEGQAVPAGLHVKMDFASNRRWAKRLSTTSESEKLSEDPTNGSPMKDKTADAASKHRKREKFEPRWRKKIRERKKAMKDKKQNMNTWDMGDGMGVINTEKKRFTRDELKKALKDFKYKDLTPKEDSQESKSFRSYEDLKKVMKEQRMAVKTEAEIVSDLYSKLSKVDVGKDELIVLLTDLEYYLHQIDNARLFVDAGGLDRLKALLNHSVADVRAAAAHTLGASLQSNSKVQVAALDTGLLNPLLVRVSIDDALAVRKKCLFALSTLLRQFPYAQKRFLDSGGLSALVKLFDAADNQGIQIKILTLLTDLLVENDFNIKQDSSTDTIQAQRTQQYKEIKLRTALMSSGWCDMIASLLPSDGLGVKGHDGVEKLVAAMTALGQSCKQAFYPAKPKLQALLSQYQELAVEEASEGDSDAFFASIHQAIQALVNQISRDEL